MTSEEPIEIPGSELRCAIVDMPKLVARVFGFSRTEATRLVKAGAVEVIEVTDGTIDYRKIAELREPIMAYSRQTLTYLRCSHRWCKVTFTAANPLPPGPMGPPLPH